jgi:7-cyano-7-deazaguanine synthase
MTKCLVVLSGGQDSTTCLFWAKAHFQTLYAISFDYGQRHSQELESASKIASMADVQHQIVNVDSILLSRSPLTDHHAKLETYSNYEEMDKIIGNRVELTFVPMRNAFFLTLAANRALFYNCYNLITGVCQADNANYFDCRDEFIRSQEETINKAIGLSDFKIHTPLMNFSKAQTVLLAKSLPGCWEALAYSHTCYAGKTPPCIMTDKTACHACTLRQHGFEEAGLTDPLLERFKNASAK